MSQTAVPLPYGLRDVSIIPYTDAGGSVLGTAVNLPYGRTLSFSAAEDFEELRGDDKLITTRGKGEEVDWDLEGGGISFEAVRAMYGGTITETGTTPNQIKRWRKLYTDVRPFFKIEGQAISDSGGDVHCILYKNRATGELKGEFGDGNFFLTGASGKTLPATATGLTDVLYDFVQNETATAIV